MKRLAEELDWFADKFDYRFKDAPWKNSKDSIPRAMIKTNGIMEMDDKKKKDWQKNDRETGRFLIFKDG